MSVVPKSGGGFGWAKLNVLQFVSDCEWSCSSFNFVKRWHFSPPLLSVCYRIAGRPTLACNYRIVERSVVRIKMVNLQQANQID